VDLYADILVRINQILQEKGMTKKALAEGLDKKPSEISKWLSGDHNFTLRSLAKLSAELGESLIQVPKRHAASSFVKDGVIYTTCTFVIQKPAKPAVSNKWENPIKENFAYEEAYAQA
jgi:transcriptional regulator with XRE-family HTH domain